MSRREARVSEERMTQEGLCTKCSATVVCSEHAKRKPRPWTRAQLAAIDAVRLERNDLDDRLLKAKQALQQAEQQRDEARAELATTCDCRFIDGQGDVPCESHAAVQADLATLHAQHRAAVEALREALEALVLNGATNVGTQRAIAAIDAIITPASPDTAPVGEALDALTDLPQNWDTYGAGPIGAAPVNAAKRFMRAIGQPPSVVPASSGGVQLEWHVEGWDIEVFFDEDGQTEGVHLTPSTRLNPATCRAQGHGRVACERCGAELVGLESVRQGQA